MKHGFFTDLVDLNHFINKYDSYYIFMFDYYDEKNTIIMINYIQYFIFLLEIHY